MNCDLTVMDTSHFHPGIRLKHFCPPRFCMKNIKMFPSGMAWVDTWLQVRWARCVYIMTNTGCMM